MNQPNAARVETICLIASVSHACLATPPDQVADLLELLAKIVRMPCPQRVHEMNRLWKTVLEQE